MTTRFGRFAPRVAFVARQYGAAEPTMPMIKAILQNGFEVATDGVALGSKGGKKCQLWQLVVVPRQS